MLVAAFLIVYVVWGSTYLAIRVVVSNGLPPLLSAGVRMLIAGGLLAALVWWKKLPMPERRDWPWLLFSGTAYFLGGNGLVMLAEQSLSSSVAALLAATTPIWLTSIEMLLPGGERPRPITWLGIILGFLGVATLMGVQSLDRSHLYLILAPLAWAVASIAAKHKLSKKPALVISAYQMLFGGAVLALVGLGFGEAAEWAPNAHALYAFAYLVVGGSLVGFVAFTYLVQHATAAQLGTYAYVNPVVAVVLGSWLLDEPLTPRMAAGALVILSGVVLVTVSKR